MAEAIAAFERAVAAAEEDRELRLALEGELAATLANVTSATEVATRLAAYRDLAGETPAERMVLALQAFVAIQQNEPAKVAGALIDRALLSGEFVAEQTAGTITFADGIMAAILAEREPLCLKLLTHGSGRCGTPRMVDCARRGAVLSGLVSPPTGGLQEAWDRVQVSLAVSDERGWQAFTPMASAVLCLIEVERGRLDAAAAALEQLGAAGDP